LPNDVQYAPDKNKNKKRAIVGPLTGLDAFLKKNNNFNELRFNWVILKTLLAIEKYVS